VPLGVEHEDRVVGDRVDEGMEAMLRLAELFRDAALARPVARALHEAGARAALEEGGRHDVGPEARPVLADAPALALEAPAGGGALEVAPRGAAVVGRVKGVDRSAHDVVGVVSGDDAGAVVPAGHAAFGVDHDHADVGDAVEEALKVGARERVDPGTRWDEWHSRTRASEVTRISDVSAARLAINM